MIVIYGICKNEATFAERFMRSTVGADRVILCDTGSTDGTPDILRSLGAEVNDITVAPWRFDLARNMALSYVPQEAQICISMDLDEVLVPGWKQIIEEAWEPGTTMLRYPLVHNWDDPERTRPRLSVWGFKIHSRKGYIWCYPIHEILERTEPGEKAVVIDKEIVRHYPDINKAERSTRIEIFERWIGEYWNDPRMVYLYGRELFHLRRYGDAIPVFKRYLEITQPYLEIDRDGIAETRGKACRNIARCLAVLGKDKNEVGIWMIRSLGEAPYIRDNWIRLAEFWIAAGDSALAFACIRRGKQLAERGHIAEIEEECWDDTRLNTLLERTFNMMMAEESNRGLAIMRSAE